jgi:transcriptional regulator with XRE-family HTH domain
MGRGRKKCTANEQRLRDQLAEKLKSLIGTGRGDLSLAAKKTGIAKQSLSLYFSGNATPTPETLRKLCAGLNLRFDIEGAIISASDLPANPIRRKKSGEQLSLSLTDAILSVDPGQLRDGYLAGSSRSARVSATS